MCDKDRDIPFSQFNVDYSELRELLKIRKILNKRLA